MSLRGLLWCGGGDLNPYGIAPASTSSDFKSYPRVARAFLRILYRAHPYPPVFPVFPGNHWNTAGSPSDIAARHPQSA